MWLQKYRCVLMRNVEEYLSLFKASIVLWASLVWVFLSPFNLQSLFLSSGPHGVQLGACLKRTPSERYHALPTSSSENQSFLPEYVLTLAPPWMRKVPFTTINRAMVALSDICYQAKEFRRPPVNSLVSKQNHNYSGREHWWRWINHLTTVKGRFQCKYQLF